MAMTVLPVAQDAFFFRILTVIEDKHVLLDVRWNAGNARIGVGGSWFLDVREVDETPIACGIRVVLGAFLGRRSSHPLFRDGVLVAYDTSKRGLEAGINDLGRRVILAYVPVEDLIALRAAVTAP